MKKAGESENLPVSTKEETKSRAETSNAVRTEAEKSSKSEASVAPNRLWSIVPGLVIVLSVSVYIMFDQHYIQCAGNENTDDCQKLQGDLISKVDNPMNLSDANAKITNVQQAINADEKLIGNLTNEISNTQASHANISKQIAEARSANTNTANIRPLINTRSSWNEVLESQESQLETLTGRKEGSEKQLAAIQKQLSARYSSRMLWVFLTGVSLTLSVAAIVIAIFAIWNSLKSAGRSFQWKRYLFPLGVIIATSGAAFLFAFCTYRNKEGYMSVVLPMLNQSLSHEGSFLIDGINFYNVIVFAVIIFLVVASCSILYKVLATGAENNEKAEKSNAYSISRKYLQAILYVGAAMLVVGIIRVGVIQEWHLSFVSDVQENAYIDSLRSFFGSSLNVQAGFYSILLAVIYFPAAYFIRQNTAALDLEVKETEDKGLSFNWTDFIPKLISVFSPILAAPLGALIGYFFSGGS